MRVMTTARAAIPAGPWTVDDLDDFPEGDTRRYELIDGALLRLLQDSAPDHLEVFLPIDAVLPFPVRVVPARLAG